VYKGDFENHIIQGKVEFTWADERVYEGHFPSRLVYWDGEWTPLQDSKWTYPNGAVGHDCGSIILVASALFCSIKMWKNF
jgi:hypothetical protein